MGMSASQARLLSLTSRMSDLEFNAQQISNRRIELAVRSSDISTQYANSLDAKKLQIRTGYDDDSSIYQDITFNNLTSPNTALCGQYGLSDNYGRLIVTKDMATNFKTANGDLNKFLELVGAGVNIKDAKGNEAKGEYNLLSAQLKQMKADYPSSGLHEAEVIMDAAGKAYYPADYENATSTNTVPKQVFNPYGLSTQTYLDIFDKSYTHNSYSDIEIDTTLNYWNSKFPNGEFAEGTIFSTFKKIQSELKDKNATIGEETNPDYIKNKRLIDMIQNMFDAITVYKESGNTITGAEAKNIFNGTAGTQTISGQSIAINQLNSATSANAIASIILSQDSATETEYNYKEPRGTTSTFGKQDYENKYDDYYNAKIADVVEQYQIKALEEKLATYKSSPSDNESFYTNIFNRMQQGYKTLENEDSQLNNSTWLYNQLKNGNLHMEFYDPDSAKWKSTSWATSTDLREQTDNEAITKAEAEYEAEMAKINVKDKQLELELKDIDTEHNAVQTEHDSVKEVIKKNIDRSFKMFG